MKWLKIAPSSVGLLADNSDFAVDKASQVNQLQANYKAVTGHVHTDETHENINTNVLLTSDVAEIVLEALDLKDNTVRKKSEYFNPSL